MNSKNEIVIDRDLERKLEKEGIFFEIVGPNSPGKKGFTIKEEEEIF